MRFKFNLRRILKQIRFYEYCKDSERSLNALKPIWINIEEPPDLDGLSEILACEVLLLCGSVISSHGTTRQKKHYQEMANNMLSNAREMAIAIGERNLLAESEKQIAVAYWRHGQYENAIAYSNTVLSHYTELEQLTNNICLLTQANLLMLHLGVDDPASAFKTFEKIKPFVEDSDDFRLKTIFYNQAAGIYVYSDKFEAAIPLLEKTIEFATLTKNTSLLGNAFNNLANAYIRSGHSKEALEYVNKAIGMFLKINQLFYLAVSLETKSQIYLRTGDFKEALFVINESVALLEKGENYPELCESLWTRIEILAKSGERLKALRQYNNLVLILNKHLSLAIEDFYLAKFDKLLYLINGSHFDDVETNFRKHLLDQALGRGGGIITATAKLLEVDHQRLSKMVGKFPDLKNKHKVKLITRTGNSAFNPKSKSKKNPEPPMVMKLKTDRLKHMGLPKGTAVRFTRCPVRELDLSLPIIIQDADRKYHCGFLVDAFDMFAFEDGLGNIEATFLVSEILDAGQVVEVFDENTQEFILFENF